MRKSSRGRGRWGWWWWQARPLTSAGAHTYRAPGRSGCSSSASPSSPPCPPFDQPPHRGRNEFYQQPERELEEERHQEVSCGEARRSVRVPTLSRLAGCAPLNRCVCSRNADREKSNLLRFFSGSLWALNEDVLFCFVDMSCPPECVSGDCLKPVTQHSVHSSWLLPLQLKHGLKYSGETCISWRHIEVKLTIRKWTNHQSENTSNMFWSGNPYSLSGHKTKVSP